TVLTCHTGRKCPASFLGAAPMEDPTDIRLQLRQRGFSVLPISGKRPPMDGWQTLDANTDTIALWAKVYPLANNTRIHTKKNPAIDDDIMSPEAGDAIEGLIRARFEEHGMISARFGFWPKRAFLFRTDRPFRKLTLKLIAPNGKGEKIEI